MGDAITRFSSQNPGMMPIIVNGMAIIMTSGMVNEAVCPTSRI